MWKEGSFSAGLGNKTIPLARAEAAKWEKALKPLIDDYVKDTTSKGLPGKEAVKEVETLIKKYKNISNKRWSRCLAEHGLLARSAKDSTGSPARQWSS